MRFLRRGIRAENYHSLPLIGLLVLSGQNRPMRYAEKQPFCQDDTSRLTIFSSTARVWSGSTALGRSISVRSLAATCRAQQSADEVVPRGNHHSFSGEAEMNFSVNDKRRQSARISRRQLLQAGGIGGLTLGLPGMVAAGVDRDLGLGGGAAEKSCIFILLCGGPSHLDTWDLKPEAPAEIRGPYQPIATTVPGMRISELHPRLATLTQHFSLIRSMTHVGNISNHSDAMHHCLSGQANAPADAPYIGSILAKVRSSQRTVASYVWLIKCVGDPVFCAPNIGTGGHLGMTHSPLFVGSAANHPAMPGFKAPQELLPAVPPERMHQRRRLLAGLNPAESASGGNRVLRDWQDLHGRAFELVSGPSGRQAYELEREPVTVRDRYGMHPLGQNLLLARRLVEAGVGFVTVNGWTGPSPTGGGGAPSSSWDMHGGEMGMGSAFGDGSYRSEERRVGKECRSRGSPLH